MARWSGWGAGPAGAGSTGGPSRAFLAAALVGCAIVTVVFVSDGHYAAAAVSTLAAVYFALRMFGVFGR
jgi:membrane protein DedA with SNARE-associated domain